MTSAGFPSVNPSALTSRVMDLLRTQPLHASASAPATTVGDGLEANLDRALQALHARGQPLTASALRTILSQAGLDARQIDEVMSPERLAQQLDSVASARDTAAIAGAKVLQLLAAWTQQPDARGGAPLELDVDAALAAGRSFESVVGEVRDAVRQRRAVPPTVVRAIVESASRHGVDLSSLGTPNEALSSVGTPEFSRLLARVSKAAYDSTARFRPREGSRTEILAPVFGRMAGGAVVHDPPYRVFAGRIAAVLDPHAAGHGTTQTHLTPWDGDRPNYRPDVKPAQVAADLWRLLTGRSPPQGEASFDEANLLTRRHVEPFLSGGPRHEELTRFLREHNLHEDADGHALTAEQATYPFGLEWIARGVALHPAVEVPEVVTAHADVRLGESIAKLSWSDAELRAMHERGFMVRDDFFTPAFLERVITLWESKMRDGTMSPTKPDIYNQSRPTEYVMAYGPMFGERGKVPAGFEALTHDLRAMAVEWNKANPDEPVDPDNFMVQCNIERPGWKGFHMHLDTHPNSDLQATPPAVQSHFASRYLTMTAYARRGPGGEVGAPGAEEAGANLVMMDRQGQANVVPGRHGQGMAFYADLPHMVSPLRYPKVRPEGAVTYSLEPSGESPDNERRREDPVETSARYSVLVFFRSTKLELPVGGEADVIHVPDGYHFSRYGLVREEGGD